MPQLTLDQILVPLKLTTDGGLTMSGSFSVTGSSIFTQTDPNIPAITVSGSEWLADSPGIATGSLEGNTGSFVDGGSF